MFGIGSKPPTALQQLRSGRWTCGSCDAEHGWPFDLGANHPDPWPHGDALEPNDALRLNGDFLSEDFCVLGGEYHMIRCVLPIPVVGLEEGFGFGCWCTLSRANFDKYVERFNDREIPDEPMWTGWLMNQLADLIEGTAPIGMRVQPRPDRQRPLLWVSDDNHPLAIAQDAGISPERMLEILRFYGHGPA